MQPLVLCYHGISDFWNHQLAVTTQAFEQQLQLLLRRGYRPGPAAKTLAGRGRVLHVTFDDAYRNVADAVPILERLQVPATVFACTGFASDGRPLDVPEVASAAAADPEHMATMDWDMLRGFVNEESRSARTRSTIRICRSSRTRSSIASCATRGAS